MATFSQDERPSSQARKQVSSVTQAQVPSISDSVA